MEILTLSDTAENSDNRTGTAVNGDLSKGFGLGYNQSHTPCRWTSALPRQAPHKSGQYGLVSDTQAGADWKPFAQGAAL